MKNQATIKRIVINKDKGVVAIVGEDARGSRRGVAKCHSEDEFDLVSGFCIAFTKFVTGMSYEDMKEYISLNAEFHSEEKESGSEADMAKALIDAFVEAVHNRMLFL